MQHKTFTARMPKKIHRVLWPSGGLQRDVETLVNLCTKARISEDSGVGGWPMEKVAIAADLTQTPTSKIKSCQANEW